MDAEKTKYDLSVITAAMYNYTPQRYELRKGTLPDAPPCPFGHRFKWIGYDLVDKKYVRLTKSVFKRLIKLRDRKEVASYEASFIKSGEGESNQGQRIIKLNDQIEE